MLTDIFQPGQDRKRRTWRQKLAKWLFIAQAGVILLTATWSFYRADMLFGGSPEEMKKMLELYYKAEFKDAKDHKAWGKRTDADYLRTTSLCNLVERHVTLCMLSCLAITVAAFTFSGPTKAQLWYIRVMVTVWFLSLIKEVTCPVEGNTIPFYMWAATVVGGILSVLSFIAQHIERTRSPRYLPSLYLACTHAVGIACWAVMCSKDVWIPEENKQGGAIFMVLCLTGSIVTLLTASAETPKAIHFSEHLLWLVFSGYYAVKALTNGTYSDVYSKPAMVIWFASTLVAFVCSIVHTMRQ